MDYRAIKYVTCLPHMLKTLSCPQECYKCIDNDFSSALKIIIQAVEKLTKIKRLVGGTQTVLQNSSQVTPNIISRTPGESTIISSCVCGPYSTTLCDPMHLETTQELRLQMT